MICQKKWLVFYLFSLIFIISQSCYAKISVQLSRDKITLGETLSVIFNLKGLAKPPSPDLSPFDKDFLVVGTNYRSAINIINGLTDAQVFFEVSLEPKHAGQLVIPEIDFGKDHSEVATVSVTENITVNKPVNQDQDHDVFFEAQFSTATPYVQSQLLYTLRLFYRKQLENPRIELPNISNGIVAGASEDRTYQKRIKNKTYLVVEKDFFLFPQKAGKWQIPASRFHALQFDNNANWLNDPFSISSGKPLDLATQAFSLDVKQIPSNYQGKVWLPAENLTVRESWSVSPHEWQVGTPVTRTIMIEAEGLRADQIPDLLLEDIKGMNSYADPIERSNRIQGKTLFGTWKQKITYIPNTAQSFIIPAIQINWWNIKSNTNEQLKLASSAVFVKDKVKPSSSSKASTEPVALAKVPTVISHSGTSFSKSPWFWIAIFLLVSWLLTILFFIKYQFSRNKTSPAPNKINPREQVTLPLSYQRFIKACEEGDRFFAEKFLLSWAEKEWQISPRTLGKLSEAASDTHFKKAVTDLEKALYARHTERWDGHELLSSYQQIKGQAKNKKTILKKDLLPPLNP